MRFPVTPRPPEPYVGCARGRATETNDGRTAMFSTILFGAVEGKVVGLVIGIVVGIVIRIVIRAVRSAS